MRTLLLLLLFFTVAALVYVLQGTPQMCWKNIADVVGHFAALRLMNSGKQSEDFKSMGYFLFWRLFHPWPHHFSLTVKTEQDQVTGLLLCSPVPGLPSEGLPMPCPHLYSWFLRNKSDSDLDGYAQGCRDSEVSQVQTCPADTRTRLSS